jgi:NADH:ubiquinone oxidoreductase subunit E
VCTTTPCNICGAEGVVKALLQHTGCGELGMTSPDGKWTVIEVECLGACGFATPIMINDDFIESVTPETVPDLVKRYSA